MNKNSPSEMVFAFDDSQIIIQDVPHTIIAGVGTNDPRAIHEALEELKSQFGVPSDQEVKWNGMALVQKDREALSNELLSLLHESAPMVTISEGLDRQIAAEHSARQVSDYLACHSYRLEQDGLLSMTFDEGIISDAGQFQEFLHASFPPPVSNAHVTSVRSHESALVQLADVTAGFNRLVADISLGGRPNKQIAIFDETLGQSEKTDLLSLICLSLRWSTWGYVPPPPDPDNVTFDGRWPFKTVGGYGLRVISSISPDRVKEIYDTWFVYMGCMH